MKEKSLFKKFKLFLEENEYIYKQEVTFLERKIDLAAIKDNKIFSFELKVNDWKSVLSQAITCKICSNYSYVALWHACTPQDLSAFESYGIGVFTIEETTKLLIDAQESNITHHSLLEETRRIILS
ncbi:MAG: hypothetical protein ACFE9L_09040 [Candidatus Hodarchaeota archaeon]